MNLIYDTLYPCPYFQGRCKDGNSGFVLCNNKKLQMKYYPPKVCVHDNSFRDCPQYRYMKVYEKYQNKKEN